VAIAGAPLENLLTTLVLASAVRSRLQAHVELVRDFDRKLHEGYEQYRSRMAGDLHDDLSQRLLATRIALHKERHAWKPESIDLLEEQLQSMALAVRDLSHQIHPGDRGLSGFVNALEDLAASMTSINMKVVLDTRMERDLLPTAGLELYRMVQEALSNAVRHGKASRVDIRVGESGQMLELSVDDNGNGMDTAQLVHGVGLESIRSRSIGLGGEFALRSFPGNGTTVAIRIPLVRIAL
jgi:signal transduction histidine kinase